MWVRSKLWLWGVCLPLLMSTAMAQEAAVAPPVPAPPTLWNFLGIPQGARKVHGALFNTKGNRPKLEQKPALKAIGDPENLKSKNGAIKQAAVVKQEEDLKPQKIKAIKYLASIGCGCYDKDGEITAALMAAAEDCTEEVRLTTMEELLKLACGKCCSKCGMTCCCKEPMLKKLAQIAYMKDEFGCYIEPSSRVRELAAQVLQQCCPNPLPRVIEAEKKKEEPKPSTPTPNTKPEKLKPEDGGKKESIGPEGDDKKDSNSAEEVEAKEDKKEEDKKDEEKKEDEKKQEEQKKVDALTRFRMSDYAPAVLASNKAPQLLPNRPAAIVNPDIQTSASPNPEGGVVIGYDPRNMLAYVHFEDPAAVVPVGTEVYIRVDPTRGKGFRGMWKVVATAKGRANLVPIDAENENLIVPGDHVMFGEPPVSITPVIFIQK